MFGDILVFQCLQKQNLVFFWYQGITNNPNQLGVCLVAPFIACLYLVFGNNIVKQRITKILIICNAAFLLFVIWCTSSRSCLLACTVGLLIVLVYKFKTSIVFTKRKMLLFISVTFFLVLISLFNFDSILAFLVKTFLYKYGSSQNDISSNRFEMWDQVIDGSKVLGYGYTYIPCHNDYFIYVQKYGIIFSSLFYLFILLVLLVLPKIKMKTEEKIFCSIYIITCVIVSMLEEIISMFGKPLVMMMFIAMGLVIKNYRKDMVKKC